MKILILVFCFMSVSWARPQQFPDANIFADGNDSTTAVAPLGAVTTASPQFLACLQACPSTMEYNPICGTDNQNYHNNGRLQCAQRCGKSVAAVRSGICTSS